MINYLDIVKVISIYLKADAVLVIDADAVLSSSVSLECFQMISRWDSQIL